MTYKFLNDLIKRYSNDYELGKAVRFYFNLKEKNKTKTNVEIEILFYKQFK